MVASYSDRIDRIVRFLNEQVQSSHSLRDLASVAEISPYHFHRVYRAVTGETPSGTLRRLRIARAVAMLRDSTKTITEIAFDVGYETSQAFSKAFRQRTGHSATEARKDRSKLDALIEQLSGAPKRRKQSELEVRLVSVEPFKVIASRHIGRPEGLFAAFGALFEWGEKSGLLNDYRGIYGIPVDDPRDEEQARFDCCFDFGPKAVPDKEYRKETLGGGLYTVTRLTGPYDGLEDKYDEFYGSWLASSNYVLRDSRAYNHYVIDPGTVPPEQWQTDIYLPVASLPLNS
ncbi:MAG: AraC family transcriptional regulator [Gammaproteobacteria bacterium]|nr:AraC family transcriptional regulator [Gammaproteobacteria bacterium]